MNKNNEDETKLYNQKQQQYKRKQNIKKLILNCNICQKKGPLFIS